MNTAESESPMHVAFVEACALVARHFTLKPVDVEEGSGVTAKHARWVVWTILRDVTGWNVQDIAETSGASRMGVVYGLSELQGKITGRRADKRLKERVEACLREAAGGS